ncbi:MAG: hypothetical protein ABSF08_09255 [Candidatus Cybelea sp.]|jgi:hypothetical protein
MSFTCLRAPVRLGAALVIALGLPAISACSGSSQMANALPPGASVRHSAGVEPTSAYSFKTINDPADPTTEILGINNLGKICGYYGNPYVGFYARPPYTANKFYKELYPGAADTVVTSINNTDALAGWYEDTKGRIFGFTEWEGIWTKYQDNHLLHEPQYTKLLGLSDDELAVGYYQLNGIDHGFELNLSTGKFQSILPPGAKSSSATGINGKGDIVGWLTLASGVTEGWLLKGGTFTEFAYPAASQTQATGINWSDDIVGSFEDASGNTHGFVLSDVLATPEWTQIDDPNAKGSTVVTSVNNHHSMTGYYQDGSGNIDGFLATLNQGGN